VDLPLDRRAAGDPALGGPVLHGSASAALRRRSPVLTVWPIHSQIPARSCVECEKDPGWSKRPAQGTRWHADETYLEVNGRWRYLYRAIDREGNLIEALLSEQRDMDAARRFLAAALASVGHAREQVTTDGHDAYPGAIREALGPAVTHRCSRYKNNRIAQDHRRVKQRYYPMRGFGGFVSAARFRPAFAEQRHYFRAAARSSERVPLADQRCRFRERWATVMAEMAAA
jgi:putative transposase